MKRIEYRGGQWKFPFILYRPEHCSGKLPLILQLHGAGERGSGEADLARVDVNGFSAFLAGAGADTPSLVVMPQCPPDTFWAAQVESILAFLQQLKDAFEIDEDRVYLTGLSMGGYGTWFTAMARPELFAAIAPVCGGGMAWNASVLTMPVWAFHGAADPVVSVAQSDEMVHSLQAWGGNVRYTRMDGVAHDVWLHTYDAALMQWLLQQHR